MSTLWHRRLGTAVILVALLSSGCNLMALPFFLLPGMEPTQYAKCKLASDDKDKEVRVVILASSGLETRPEFIRADRELAQDLVNQLRERFKKNKERVTVVQNSHVEKYKEEHPNWRSFDAQEVGKYFNADYVIDLEIESMSLYEPGSANTLFRGRAAIAISVVDVHHPSEGPKYNEQYTAEYPRAKGPIPVDGSNPAQFRQKFLAVVARELSWKFSNVPQDDTQTLD